MKKKKAFTLIELLVVIAIIALLLSIIVPSLGKAKDYAKRTLCMSNVRQIGLGLKIYAQSNDDILLPLTELSGTIRPWTAVVAYTGGPTDPTPVHLAHLYELGLIETPEVFYCPAQNRNSDYPYPYYYDFYTQNGSWGSYIPDQGGGHDFVRTSYNYWTYQKKRMTELHATKPLIVDNLQEWEVVPHRKGRLSASVAPGTPNPSALPQGVTALFADGHVNFCISSDIFDKSLWPLQNGYSNGPGNRKDSFLEILRVIEGHQ